MADFNLRNERRKRIFRYAPLVFWIGLILFLSSGQGSMPQTSRFVRPLLEFLFPNSPEETLLIYHAYIRKSAHFFVYAVLAFWSWRALKDSSQTLLRKFRYLFALAVVLLVAAIDETNQSFNDARSGSVYDVALDFAGGCAMISVIYLTLRKRANAGDRNEF